MRTLCRNKTKIHYALYTGKTDVVDANGFYTGEKTLTYSDPVEMWANVSASRGSIGLDIFGVKVDYTKTIITDDLECPIDEHSRLWIGVDTTAPYNYVVTSVAKSLNSITYAVKEVDTSA